MARRVLALALALGVSGATSALAGCVVNAPPLTLTGGGGDDEADEEDEDPAPTGGRKKDGGAGTTGGATTGGASSGTSTGTSAGGTGGGTSGGTTGTTTPGIDATNGSGGAAGFQELTSASGLTYQIQAPAGAGQPGDKAHGLLVLLHGSSASNYGNFVRMMATAASQHDLIPVSVKAPNGQGWNEGGQQAQVQAADLLHQLVQQDLFAKFNIDKARVLFSGQSSGGGFLSSHFVPAHAKDYKGGALLQCGAAPPSTAITFAPNQATKAGFRLHFEITTGDTIWPQSYANAVTAYTNAGMSLTKDNTKSGGHCAFDQQQVILDRIGTLLAK